MDYQRAAERFLSKLEADLRVQIAEGGRLGIDRPVFTWREKDAIINFIHVMVYAPHQAAKTLHYIIPACDYDHQPILTKTSSRPAAIAAIAHGLESLWSQVMALFEE